MQPTVSLVSNHDGTYDIVVSFQSQDVEISEDFDLKKSLAPKSQGVIPTVKEYAKKVKVAGVKILVSGVLVATLALSTFLSAFAASDRYSMGYLYSGTDHQQIEYVNRTNSALDTVSPSYFNLQEDGSLVPNYISEYFINTMHSQGIRVVPFLSNHWNRTAGVNALKDVESLATQLAAYIEQYNLDGVNIDIENVTHEQRDQYTQLVKLLREKVPQEKEISVAVAANPNDWQVGWHGSYDYAALAQYADHLLIMAYDEHYEGGDAGPVASIGFVEDSIRYALSKASAGKIVVGIPFYGRVWGLDSSRIKGKGVSSQTILDILNQCEATVTYDASSQSVKAEFTITESSPKFTVGGDFVLEPGRYVVWFENDQSYEAKLDLVQKYNLKGVGSWSLGQEDPSIWAHYDSWLNGEDTNAGDSSSGTATPEDPVAPSAPEESEQPSQPSEPAPPSEPANPEEPDASEVPNIPNEPSAPESSEESPELSAPDLAEESDTPQAPESQPEQPSRPPESDAPSSMPEIPSQPNQPDTPSESLPDTGTDGNTSSGTDNGAEDSTGGNSGEQGATVWIRPDLDIVTIYQNQNLNGRMVATLSGGASLTLLQDMGGGVYRVRLPSGQTGYVSASYVSFTQSSAAEDNPAAPEYTVYTVKAGDNLWNIATAYLGSGARYPEIMQLNGLTSHVIYPGMQLRLPAGAQREYTVARGDSLWKIARVYLGDGARYPEIMQLNGLTSHVIHPGQVLKLPAQ